MSELGPAVIFRRSKVILRLFLVSVWGEVGREAKAVLGCARLGLPEAGVNVSW